MDDHSIELSVIIVSWNVSDLLAACLKSVQECSSEVHGLEIFVVDNASSDATVEMVQRDFPGVHLIANIENRGFAAANNQALRLVKGKFVLLLNPDTIVRPSAFRKLIIYLAQNPRIGMAGPLLKLPDETIQADSARRLPGLLNAMLLIALPGERMPLLGAFLERWLAFPYDYAKTQPVEAITGAAMMVRQSVLEKIGLLDETFFHCGEDVEWCDRVHKAGLGVGFVHDAVIMHYCGQSSIQNLVHTDINATLSIQHYYQRRFGAVYSRFYEFIMRIIGSPWIIIVGLIALLARRLSWADFQQRFHIALGIFKWKYVGAAAVRKPNQSNIPIKAIYG